MSGENTIIENEMLGAYVNLVNDGMRPGIDIRIFIEDPRADVGTRPGVHVIETYKHGNVLVRLREDDCEDAGLDTWRDIKHYIETADG